ncbi:MAG TPA: hypothetical protein VHG93_17125 [Longimicrobium sp.]|nr:hypothetical protein [Longimicrobium sp.]
MSRWTDPEAWARVLAPEGCVICREGGPTHVIAELEVSWVTMSEETAGLPGGCAMFFRRHVVELHDLTEEEGAAWMRDVRRLSRLLKEATGAVKMISRCTATPSRTCTCTSFPATPAIRSRAGP